VLKIKELFVHMRESGGSQSYTFIDLFAGCGGLSLGAMRAGLKGLFAIEYQKNAFDTLRENLIEKSKSEFDKLEVSGFDWPSELPIGNYDINFLLSEKKDFIKSLKGKVDVVIGGPPCQGFSIAGKRNEKDPRNQLYKSYLSFISIIQPKILLIENVSGIASKFSATSSSYKDQIIKNLEKEYYVGGKLLSSEIFGVPQKRRRYFIIGFSKEHFTQSSIDLNSVFERIVNDSYDFTRNYKIQGKSLNISNSTVVKALGDLDGTGLKSILYADENAKSKNYKTFPYKPENSDYQILMRNGNAIGKIADSHRLGDHSAETKAKYKGLILISNRRKFDHSGFNFTKQELESINWNSKKQIINVLRRDAQSPTITTCPFDYIHYKTPRILTVREFARLQSFPDWFVFKGIYATSGSLSFTAPRYTQIGNAVPPLMAESILKTLKNYL
jgi:DNA (cytosine-5)-methyltransferase 1